ncbi:MAG: thymidylate synthase, partial [bacterium]|nr:thymidylate synthase [bacterium]
SEMIQINAKTPGEAWRKAAQEVFISGDHIKDGNTNLKELMNVFLSVENPLGNDVIMDRYADPKMIEWMRNNFLSKNPVDSWGYSYGQRFMDFDGINQIQNIIEKLKENPESKSATITLMNPKGDKHHVPCIVALDFKVRNNQLMLTAFFRSQDVGKKIYADIICLGEIEKQVADAVDIAMGPLNILIVSLHAYEADFQKIKDITS